VIWPKLFRRIVPYLAAGFTDFDGFATWLRADPVNRDDALLLLADPARESGTNCGRLRGLALGIGVREAGVPAPVVVGEGVVEYPGADLQ